MIRDRALAWWSAGFWYCGAAVCIACCAVLASSPRWWLAAICVPPLVMYAQIAVRGTRAWRGSAELRAARRALLALAAERRDPGAVWLDRDEHLMFYVTRVRRPLPIWRIYRIAEEDWAGAVPSGFTGAESFLIHPTRVMVLRDQEAWAVGEDDAGDPVLRDLPGALSGARWSWRFHRAERDGVLDTGVGELRELEGQFRAASERLPV